MIDQLFVNCEYVSGMAVTEPLNVAANAAYLVAAWRLFKKYQASAAGLNADRVAAVILMALLGLGGGLYHAFPNRLTIVGEVAPLAFLTTLILLELLRYWVQIGVLHAVFLMAVFGAVLVLTWYVPGPYRLNDSIGFLPMLAALSLTAGWLRWQGRHDAAPLLAGCGVLAVGFVFRVGDMYLCALVPCGTHFLWKIASAWGLYLLSQGIPGPVPRVTTAAAVNG